MYNRTVVCDIDDTISFTTSRDWKNAKPNLPLIKKLNDLYDNGWTIIYATARGSISCETREKAREKYEPIILEWFKRWNVKYSKLSFMKELGMYYIDDKSVKPDEFLNLDIKVLSGGLTNAIIEKHGNRVYKTCDKALNEAAWYEKAKYIIPTVKVHSLIGNTICIDYIEKTDEPKISDVFDIFDKFSMVKRYEPFSLYIERINKHMNIYYPSYQAKVLMYYDSIKDFCDTEKSFCHGDFTLDNMIVNNGITYLIDPIYDDCYSSWLLDVSKLIQSCRRFRNDFFKGIIEDKFRTIIRPLKILELGHWIRMRKYASELVDFVDKNIEIVLNELENMKNDL